MAAVIGADLEVVERSCDAAQGDCWVANDNAPGQVVLAGTAEGLEAATARVVELGARRVMPLAVDGAFHTPLMEAAVSPLTDAIATAGLEAPSAPVVSNVDASAHADPATLAEHAPRHVTQRVRWRESVETMCEMGVTAFVEIGHGAMLAALGKRIRREVPVVSVAVPADLERLEALT
jgi:[acyl-carrier-protein] S-malonyltransferase